MDSARTKGCVGVGQRRSVIHWRIASLANAAAISTLTLPVLLSAAFRAFHEKAASPRFARVGSCRVQTHRCVTCDSDQTSSVFGRVDGHCRGSAFRSCRRSRQGDRERSLRRRHQSDRPAGGQVPLRGRLARPHHEARHQCGIGDAGCLRRVDRRRCARRDLQPGRARPAAVRKGRRPFRGRTGGGRRRGRRRHGTGRSRRDRRRVRGSSDRR